MTFYRQPIFNFIEIAFRAYYWLLIIRILMSWVPSPSEGPIRKIYQFVYDLTEPLLSFLRKRIPLITMGSVGLDISPIIAIFLLSFLQQLVFAILIRLSI
ncbi:MAG: YggT family protein [Actinomycetota bacterium]|nr:YggT family protein [Actinomycetota bacterium]